MKKIIILLAVVISAVIILPIIGNIVIEDNLNTQIEKLKSNGIAVQSTSEESSFFTSSKHYEFVLEDGTKFVQYINQFSDTQIPISVDMMLEGMVLGMDLHYSNFMFNTMVEVDVYPLALPEQTIQAIKKEDINLLEYVTKFLKTRGLLYHVNYDMNDKSFDGFVKDINEEYVSKDLVTIKLVLTNMTYNGQGSLLHPNKINSKISKIFLVSIEKDEKVELSINDVESSSVFTTKTTYTTSANIKSAKINFYGVSDSLISLKDVRMDVSANTEGKKAEFSTTSSIEELVLNSTASDLKLDKLSYDVSIKNVDKDAFEEFRTLISQSQTSMTTQAEKEISNSLINLFSKGLLLNIKDISIGKISMDAIKDVDAFSLNVLLDVKEDANLIKYVNTNPDKLLETITLDSKLSISKDFYALMNKTVPATALAGGFAKKVGNNYIFELKLKDSKVSVNGRSLK